MPPLLMPGPGLGPLGYARGGAAVALPPAGYNAWYAADRLAGLSADDPVATWPDGSVNAYDMTQATGTKQPAYKTGVQNGLPAVLFTRASSQVLNNASGLGMGNTAFSLYAVCKLTAANVNAMAVSAGRDNAPASGYSLGTVSGARWAAVRNGAAVIDSGVTSDTNACLLGMVFGSGTLTIYRNGTSLAASAQTFVTPATSSHLGSDGDAAGEDYWGGHLMEALFYPAAHDAAARATVEAYLNGKWALY